MEKNSEYKSNFIWNLIGVTLYGLVSLFLLIFVKRINGIDESGIFSYAYSICTLFFYISLYFSRTYQIANYNNSKSFNHFLSFRIISSFVSLILIIVFCFINKFSIFNIIIITLLMLFRIIDAISDTFYGYLQEHNELYKVGISYTLKSIMGIICFFVFDILTKNLYLSILSMVFINLLIFVVYDIKNFRKLCKNKIYLDFSNIILILKESFPIFIFSFLSIFLANAEKYVIVYYTNDEIQSIFGMLIMPATVLSLVGNYLINPFINDLNKYYKDKDYQKFDKLSLKILIALFIIGLFGTILCYLIGISILNIIFNINLNIYRMDLTLIIIASIFNASCMIISNLLIILNKNILQTIFYFISSLVAVLTCILLVKDDVINGATYAYLISYIINFVLYLIYYKVIIKKIEKGEKNEKK